VVVVVVVEVPAEVQVACAGGGSRGGRQDDGRGVHRAFILLPLPLHLLPNLPSVESIDGIEGRNKIFRRWIWMEREARRRRPAGPAGRVAPWVVWEGSGADDLC